MKKNKSRPISFGFLLPFISMIIRFLLSSKLPLTDIEYKNPSDVKKGILQLGSEKTEYSTFSRVQGSSFLYPQSVALLQTVTAFI